jgi:hypothetical protein
MWPVIIIIFFSAVKFAMTFPLAVVEFHFSFLETLLWTNIGGIVGIYFFTYLSGKLIAWWNRILGKSRPEPPAHGSGGRKLFTRKNRRIVRIKQKYGLLGIAFTTPFLLSIPVGTFLVVRYYRHTRSRFLYLIASNVVWSVIYTGFFMFWDGLFSRKP